MFMKKSKIIGIFTALTIMLIYGCSDNFLKDEKTDGISSEIVYSGDATAIAAVNGIYDAFQGARDGGPATNEYNTKAIFVLNRFTQDWKGNNADEQIRTYNYDPDGEIQAKMWNVHYLGIGRCNSALDNLPVAIDAGNIDTDLGNRLIGEALVLRSIFYHYLASTMGGVPLVLEIDPNDVF